MSRMLVAVLMAVLAPTLLAQSDRWQVLAYPAPAADVSRTYCYGINDAGAMVGLYLAPGSSNRAYLLSEGQYFTIHPAGATSSSAWGINARGDVVGDYYVGTAEHGFLLHKGTFSTIDIEGAVMTHPRAVNARGDIAGSYMFANANTAPQYGFVLTRHETIDVRVDAALSTTLFGINDEGDVVGDYKDAAGAIHGYVRSAAGEYQSLDYPNALSTSAQKINARGDIVGYYWTRETPSVSHGFVWHHGEFEQADYPGAVHTMVHGLNNSGETCGMMSFSALGTPIVWGGFARTW
jgi:uncharacterized membrane protein